MAKAQIYWDKSISAYRLKADFKLELVSFLKAQIPHSDRSYDDTTRIWTFAEKYLDGTVKLCNLIYAASNVTVLSRQQVEAASQASSSPSIRKLDSTDALLAEFMRMIPFEAAQKAYRAACMSLHPDRGGDMEKMSRVNAIWTRIEKEVYKQ